MHRTTWYAIPIVGLAVLASGLGIWTYRLHADRQALVTQSDAQYSAAFHGLVSDMNQLTERLGESEVSSDKVGFAACSRDIWRLCYAAQTEIAKLPVELMPMHNTQAFLSALANESDTWMAGNTSTKDPKVLKQVDNFYGQATKLQGELDSVQGKVLGEGLGWVAVNRAINQKKGYHTGDNQIVDGFRTMEKGLTTFSETADLGSQVEGTHKPSTSKPQGAVITPSAAIHKVAAMLGVTKPQAWKTTTSSLGQSQTVYMISGQTPGGPISAVVTRRGGHVLVVHRDRSVASDHFGFSRGENQAISWLQKQGFGALTPEIANEYDNVGYFVLVPKTRNGIAIESPISVNVALDNGEVLALDTQAYYRNPMPTHVPKHKYSAKYLRTKLNPQLTVEEEKNVIVHNSKGQPTSAIEFIGMHGKRTYGVLMDAVTGKEISVRQLS